MREYLGDSFLFAPLKIEITQTVSMIKVSEAQKVQAVSCSGVRGLLRGSAEKRREEITSFFLFLSFLLFFLPYIVRSTRTETNP